nr:unnamed protein product [Spirometra erinaceieuropaei]
MLFVEVKEATRPQKTTDSGAGRPPQYFFSAAILSPSSLRLTLATLSSTLPSYPTIERPMDHRIATPQITLRPQPRLRPQDARHTVESILSPRPERRVTLVARELANYKVNIAALSETRFSEQGRLNEVGAYCTFFWSGRCHAERRDASVDFATHKVTVGRLPCLSRDINDRLMNLHLPSGEANSPPFSAFTLPDDQP